MYPASLGMIQVCGEFSSASSCTCLCNAHFVCKGRDRDLFLSFPSQPWEGCLIVIELERRSVSRTMRVGQRTSSSCSPYLQPCFLICQLPTSGGCEADNPQTSRRVRGSTPHREQDSISHRVQGPYLIRTSTSNPIRHPGR